MAPTKEDIRKAAIEAVANKRIADQQAGESASPAATGPAGFDLQAEAGQTGRRCCLGRRAHHRHARRRC